MSEVTAAPAKPPVIGFEFPFFKVRGRTDVMASVLVWASVFIFGLWACSEFGLCTFNQTFAEMIWYGGILSYGGRATFRDVAKWRLGRSLDVADSLPAKTAGKPVETAPPSQPSAPGEAKSP